MDDTTHPQWFQFPAQVPEEINGFRLGRFLGEGGMGLVFEAIQETPIKRCVAIKFLKGCQPDDRMVLRFNMEGKTLAQMNHPNIAVIYDTGMTQAGQPYLVMELVEGMPLDEYCRGNKLDIGERVNLLVQVCAGVTHAHQRGIIHRDLKPENLLVTEITGEPVVKIIDFGIAKEFQTENGSTISRYTKAGEMLGSPCYISPEQANGEQVDIRADVFALGSVFYHLLTGQNPFEEGHQNFVQYLNKMLTSETPRPSEKYLSVPEMKNAVAAERNISAEALVREFRQDLDWIVLKALARDPRDRYQAVSDFARDLNRYLEGRPVAARMGNRFYVLKKNMKRHKLAVFAMSSILLSLVSALTISIYSLHKIRDSEQEARHAQIQALKESEKSMAINHFLTDLLMSPDPLKDGREIKVLDLLQEHQKKLDDFEGSGIVKANIMYTLGVTYYNLSQYPAALVLLKDAREISAHHPEMMPAVKFQIELELYKTLMKMGRYKETEEGLRAILKRDESFAEQQIRVQVNNSEPLQDAGEDSDRNPVRLAFVRATLGEDLRLMGNFKEALPLLRGAWETLSKVLGPESQDAVHVHYQLGIAFWSMGKLDESELILRETLKNMKSILGTKHPRTLENMGSLANVLFRQRKWKETETLHRQVYQIRIELLGEDHHATLFSMNNLGSVLYKQKKYGESKEFTQRAFAGFTRLLGPGHPDTLMALNNLGNIYRKQRKYTKAIEIYQRALEGQELVLGDKHRETNRTRYNLIRTLQKMNRMAESLPYCDAGIRAMPDESWGYHLKSKALLAAGKVENALPFLEKLYELEPNDPEAACDLIVSLAETGLAQRAKKVFSSAQDQWSDPMVFEENILGPLRARAGENKILREMLP
jgi:serine/threonine protein kinase/Tfp pilus assembly protein PilF